MQIVKHLFTFFLLTFTISFTEAQTKPTEIVKDTLISPSANKDTISKQTVQEKKNSTQEPAKTIIAKDSARIAIEKMPRKAMVRSLILPGLGQIYNKRWWKVPLVYGGFIGIGFYYEFNQRYYKEILTEVQYRTINSGAVGNPKYANARLDGLINAKDFYRRNRDLAILGGVAFYAIQAIDAYVDAKLFRYDINDELSLRVSPSFQTLPTTYAYQSFIPKIKLTLSL